MSDSLRRAEEASPWVPQKTLVEFLETLHRIFKIGTYYPEGHAVLDRAADHFQHNLQKITEAKRSAAIELKGEVMLVEGLEVTAVSPPITELKKLFRDSGIGRLEIERFITLAELLQFVRTLSLYRSQLLSVKQFTKARIVGLPSTIRIIQTEFLVDEVSLFGGGRNIEDGRGLDSVFHMLEERGLDRQQIAQCREFMNTLARKFEDDPIKLQGMPAIGWEDVLKLMTKMVTSVPVFEEGTGKVFPHNDLSVLSAIFNGLRQELDDNDSRDAINLLVTAFHRGHLAGRSETDEVEEDTKKSLQSKDRGTDMTIREIQAFVHEKAETGLVEKNEQVGRYEELAIILQLLQFPQKTGAGEGIERSLRAILAAPLSPRMVDVLIKGLVHLAECGAKGRLRAAVDIIVLRLRSMKTYSSLPFLVILCRQLQPSCIELLWPTMINELLAVGRQADQPRPFTELARIAAGIPVKAMRDQSLELEGIASIKEGRIANDIFDPELKMAYPIYAVLLESSRRMQVAARVLDNLRAAPQDWLIEAVAPLLDPAQPQHMQFIHAYLTVAQQQRYPVGVQIMAGKLVVERLPMIDEAARNEPWVAKTIMATTQVQVEGTRELLQKILVERKLIVVPKWPSPCRQAATQALKRLKRKPLG